MSGVLKRLYGCDWLEREWNESSLFGLMGKCGCKENNRKFVIDCLDCRGGTVCGEGFQPQQAS